MNWFELRLSWQSLLYPFSFALLFSKSFSNADIVHYHLIHTGYFSLAGLPLLTRKKPSVWTVHDPWAMTGHCTYPFDCERWKTGCGQCPTLAIPASVEKDRTRFMWKAKKVLYGLTDVDVVLASRFMLGMAEQSPLISKFRLHHIPFGLDLNVFRVTDSEEAKRKMGVFPGSFVIAFRSTNNPFKGLGYIKECLHGLNIERPICLLTFNERGLVDEFRGKYQIIDLGWVKDTNLTVTAYNASDVFLMPSLQEAFGMMAMEAMACGKAVIAFEGTSLSEVIYPPTGGITVPKGNVEALRHALLTLINNDDERRRVELNALRLARENYNISTHTDRMIDLYTEVIKRKRSRTQSID